jgi:hypothetical protein
VRVAKFVPLLCPMYERFSPPRPCHICFEMIRVDFMQFQLSLVSCEGVFVPGATLASAD